MQKREQRFIEPRMLTEREAMIYCGVGRSKMREWGLQIGAVKHYGTRLIRYDRRVIDRFLDAPEVES